MGLLNSISRLGQRWLGNRRFDDPHASISRLRICRFEEVESRRLMVADLHVGSVYYEQAAGDDAQPNILQFTFEGGAPGTQMTRIVIDGDKDGAGKSSGDVFFDTAPGGFGVFQSNPLKIISHDGFNVLSTQVTDGGMKLIIDLAGFEVGETLVLSVDVDEYQFVSGNEIDVNAVAEGAEFQRSHFIASFVAPHYEDVTTHTQFWDAFNQNFAAADAASGTHLNLPPDRYSSQIDLSDFTAGAVATIVQPPKPNSLSGVVYVDPNLNNQQDAGEPGIAGVSLTLWRLEGNAYATTNLTTVTDTLGNYKFENLAIGTYQVVETQPVGYFSVGATPGKVDGQVRGTVLTSDILTGINLLGGDNSVRNDFAEALYNSIAGFVGIDCEHNVNPPPIEGVVIRLLNAAGVTVRTTATDANGNYKFDQLVAGVYTIVEEQPAGYFQGDTEVGSLGGVSNRLDEISQITLVSDMHGVRYDFCELLPVSISGKVHVNTTGDCDDPANPPLANVTIELLNSSGSVIDTTQTDANGEYEFVNLPPGTYGVREIQPAGYFDGETEQGSAGGNVSNNLVTQIELLSGVDAVHYDFCEIPPAQLCGFVYVDMNNNGLKEAGEAGIANVTVELLDAGGQPTGVTVVTDETGEYCFVGLRPGTHGVREFQPSGYYDGLDTPGDAGGTAANPGDRITGAVLTGGQHGENYNFGELLPASIAGKVHVNTNGDCDDPANPPLAGVTIELLNSNGTVIGTRVTDANGEYRFDNLAPGTYSVREIQPANYFDGETEAGSAGGIVTNNFVTAIALGSGVAGVHYDFCEIPPAQLCGFVYADLNDNGLKEAGEQGISGVTLELLNANGQPTGVTVLTDATGEYCFVGLRPGTYGVREFQPAGYYDGLDTPGEAGGAAHNPGDSITDAVLKGGQHGENYNFGELPPVSIGGMVHINTTGDCESPANPPLAGVTIHLLDSRGNVISTATTGADGHYLFNNLAPGTYGVREVQPVAFFDGETEQGSAGGLVAANLVTDIVLVAGLHAVHYDFCEIPPAALSGFVFQDGPPIEVENEGDVPDVLALRDGKLTSDDTRLGGVLLQLRDGVTGLPIYGSAALPGTYAADQPITTLTDANGHYQFVGLLPGTYAVYDVKIEGTFTGIDTPGSLGGVIVSELVVTDPAVLAQLLALPEHDAILAIALPVAGNSVENNFSVVVTTVFTLQILPPPPAPPEPFIGGGFFNPLPPLFPTPEYVFPYLLQPVLTRAGGSLYTWHLSVVDAGQPRGLEATQQVVRLTSMRPQDEILWDEADLDDGEWVFAAGTPGQVSVRKTRFGIRGGIPIAGDFNGDGKSEVGVFKDGRWYIDLNDNGVWDEGDLWAQLGHKWDKPVTGDWDGDGKTDIGIYGPAWPGDPRAVAHEPGLPDPHNANTRVHKNIPRPAERTAVGERTMKLTANGQPRADLIDHVFFYGTPGDHPIVGDWNGDGTHTIAVFRDGVWRRDTDGDGKWSESDAKVNFGRSGDRPVVGDFNGDGVDELGIYRDGMWYIDTNGNGEIDPEDQKFQLGGPGDTPVVGDFNGDGMAEPAVYRDSASPGATAAIE